VLLELAEGVLGGVLRAHARLARGGLELVEAQAHELELVLQTIAVLVPRDAVAARGGVALSEALREIVALGQGGLQGLLELGRLLPALLVQGLVVHLEREELHLRLLEV